MILDFWKVTQKKYGLDLKKWTELTGIDINTVQTVWNLENRHFSFKNVDAIVFQLSMITSLCTTALQRIARKSWQAHQKF